MVGLGRVSHTHVRARIHKSIIARGCRRKRRRENFLDSFRSRIGRELRLPSFSEFHCPFHCPSRQQWRAVQFGKDFLYLTCALYHSILRETARIAHTLLRRVQVFAFQSARIARVLAKHIAAVIACVLTHNLMRYRLTGTHRSCT